MSDAIRPFISRILAAAVASFATYLNQHFGLTFGVEDQAALQTIALFVFGAVYAVVHRLVDKHVNPGDAASSHLAVAEQAQAADLKAKAGL